MPQEPTSAQFQNEGEQRSAKKSWNRPQISRLPVLGTVSIGRLEEHRAEMRSSAFRFATAFGGLLVVFGVALMFRNDFAYLLQQI